VSERDRELLHAIPLNELPPPRRLPDGTEPVTGLCEGVTGSAQRARHAAWVAAEQATWSPGMSLRSLRGLAEASMVTSHNNEVLLRSLADGIPQPDCAELGVGLLRAADAAGRGRAGWLRVVRTLDGITTDSRLHVSQAATEARDLALWTGRLAYASPEWTLASGPAHQPRDSHSLAPGPRDVPRVVAAVHQACETVTQFAWADSEQIRKSASAGRILVPTRSLPDTYDIPAPYTHAPSGSVDSVLAVYQDTAEASANARDAIGAVAEITRAPSRMLTAARASTEDSPGKEPDHSPRPVTADERHGLLGPVERTLQELGVTAPDLLQRAAAIDLAGERLISSAIGERRPRRRKRLSVQMQRRSATATLIHHALESGDPHAIALLRAQAQRQRESPEPET